MQKPWIIPLVVLILLALAFTFRWDYNATKTIDDSVVKWKTDRWTSQGWIELYSIKGIQGELPTSAVAWTTTNKPYVDSCWATRKTWTIRWYVATGAALSWLFYAAWGGPWLHNKRGIGTGVKSPPAITEAEVDPPPGIAGEEVEPPPVVLKKEFSIMTLRKLASYPLGLLVYIFAYFLSAAALGTSVSGRIFYSTLLMMAAVTNSTSFYVFRWIYPNGKSNKKVQTIFLILLSLLAIAFFASCFMDEPSNISNLPMYSVFSIGFIAYIYHAIKKEIKVKEDSTEDISA